MENQKNDNLNMLEAIVQNTEMGKEHPRSARADGGG